MLPHEYLERVPSQRWHAMLAAWLREEWNKPSRADHYVMQLTAVMAGGGKNAKITDYKIPFKFKRPGPAKSMDLETATALSKAKWFAISDYDPKTGGMTPEGKRRVSQAPRIMRRRADTEPKPRLKDEDKD